MKPTGPNITEVNFYYRIEDRATSAVFDWQNAGRMLPDASGDFVLVFSGESVNANFRKPNAWFDYQFLGVSRSGGVWKSGPDLPLPLNGVPAVNVDEVIYILGGADRAGAISNQGLVFSLKPLNWNLCLCYNAQRLHQNRTLQ